MKKVFLAMAILLSAGTAIACPASNGKAQSSSDSIDEKVYGSCEQMPQFPGGDVELMRFVYDNLRFPYAEIPDSIECARVIIQFVITKTGKIDKDNIKVIRSMSPEYDAEAVRVVKMLPNFATPGKMNGNPVNVWLTLPISFKETMKIKKTNGLTIYYPNFRGLDFVVKSMPEPSDGFILFCAAAAFTGKLLDKFDHSNIAGAHTDGWKIYKGYDCEANTGVFAWDHDNGWTFATKEHSDLLMKRAVEHDGMAFEQALLIYDGKDSFSGPQPDGKANQYRALCELRGKLCIIDSDESVPFKKFKEMLMAQGVKHALYLDMGYGWNCSFYRNEKNEPVYIHPDKGKYTTNWIVFRR